MNLKSGSWAVAGLLASALVTSASALGLGAIQVHSGLGQDFSAVVPLRLDSPSDLDGLTVGLADAAAFRRAGIAPSDAVSQLHFTVEKTGAGADIRVTGQRPVREPFLNFLISVHWNGGTLLREYTVLLNPPDYGTQRAVAASAPLAAVGTPGAGQAAAPETQPSLPIAASEPGPVAPVARQPVIRHRPAPMVARHVAPSPPIPATAARPSRTTTARARVANAPVGVPVRRVGPVKAGQTFWSIAKAVRPSASLTMSQVLLAIYDANPRAFSRGHFNELMTGSTLQIPSAAVMASTPATVAARRVADLRAGRQPPAVAPAQANRVTPRRPSHQAKGAMLRAPTATRPQVVAPVQAPAQAQPAETQASTQATAAPQASESAATRTASEVASGTAAQAANATEAANAAHPSPATQNAGGSAAAVTAAAEQAAAAVASAATTSAATAAVNGAVPASTASTNPTVEAAQASAAATQAKASPPAAAPKASAPVHKAPIHAARRATSNGSFGWRLPVLVILLLVLFTALLLRGRRKRAKVDGPVVPPPTPTPTKPTRSTGGFWSFGRGKQAHVDETEGSALGLAGGIGVAGAAAVLADTLHQPVPQSTTEGDESAAASDLETASAVEASAAVVPPPATTGAPLRDVVGAAQDFGLVEDKAASSLGAVEDPLADAEFHLAYGLYDEAIPLLKQAIAQHPERPDLKLRLEEAYFSAGKPAEFEALAAELQPTLSEPQWRELAQKGRQLCPESSLFHGVPPPDDGSTDHLQPPDWAVPQAPIDQPDVEAGTPELGKVEDEAPAGSVVDVPRLPSDDVAPAEPASVEFEPTQIDLPAEPEPVTPPREAPGDNVIDFDAAAFEPVTASKADLAPGAADLPPKPSFEPVAEALVRPARTPEPLPETLDLDHFDAAMSEPTALAAPPDEATVSGAEAQHLDLGPLDFDLSDQAAGHAPAQASATARAAPMSSASAPESEPVPTELEPAPAPAFSREPAERSAPAGDGDAVDYSGKLELAEIYASMGDNEAARSVLAVVLKDGTAEQQAAAQKLVATLAS
ncbi:MAG TPA: FimV/HubP family polar landmark protein [Nevskiaceae bacterium]|nr:FimV/HubP family polar landmark protein [Nevskiaceae bacterium]